MRFLRKGPGIFIPLFLLLLVLPTRAADDTNVKIKATFIYNFTKYIEWPESYKQGNFVVGVLGTSPILKEFAGMAATKKAGQQSFEIATYHDVKNIGRCHILYIPAESNVNMKEVLSKLKGSSTLIVTDKPGMAKQGAVINFVFVQNRQKFEINRTNAEKFKLKISSNLYSLAIMID